MKKAPGYMELNQNVKNISIVMFVYRSARSTAEPCIFRFIPSCERDLGAKKCLLKCPRKSASLIKFVVKISAKKMAYTDGITPPSWY